MLRPYPFATNKENREKAIREIMEIINGVLVDNGKKPYDIEKIIESSNDPKIVEEYNRANDIVEKDKKRKIFADNLLKNQGKKAYGNSRTFYTKIEIVEENDPNKEEKERHNQEIIDKYSNPNKSIEIVKEEIDKTFNTDPSLFYPDNLDEAIETFEKNYDVLNSCHVIDSTLGNNQVIPSGEMSYFYNYYKSTMEDGQNVYKFIKRKASPLSFFLPDDLSDIDFYMLMNSTPKINETFYKYFPESKIEFGKETFESKFDFGAEASEYIDFVQNKESIQKLGTFFKNHNKDFILKNRLDEKLDGDTFKKHINAIKSNEVDQYIKPGFDGAKYIKTNPITSNLSKPYRTAFQRAYAMYSEFEKGSFTANDVVKYLYDKKNSNKITKDESVINLHELYFLHSMVKDKKDDRSFPIKNATEYLLESVKAPLSRSKFYGMISNGKVPYDAITSINDDGFEVFEHSPDLYKSKVEIQNLKQKSISNLRNQFDKGDIKNNIKENPTKFMSFAKAINEKYNSRHPFFKIFSPFAWRESSLIKDINKYATRNGINEKDLADFIAADTSSKDYSKAFDKCTNSIKNINIIEEKVESKEKIVVDYFDKEQVKEDYKSFDNAEVVIKKDVEQNIENEEIKEEENKKFVVVDYDVNNNDVGQIVNEEQENLASNDENVL